MKLHVCLAAVLLPTTSALAQQAPASGGFPLTLHVTYSRSITAGYQQIETEIDGQQVELQGLSQGVLALRDYPARISSKVHAPSHNPNSYDIYKGYDLLLPDGKTRTYTVIGIGSSASHP